MSRARLPRSWPALERWMRRRGYVLVHTGKHARAISPSGRSITYSSTPSDQRAIKNLIAELRRAEDREE